MRRFYGTFGWGHTHPISKEEMKDFKKYLETKGANLSQNQELLKYFALPYINNPLKHESFAPLFQEEWVDNI